MSSYQFKQYENGRWYIEYKDNDGEDGVISEVGFATREEAEEWWADHYREVI
jgi:hypothetical protein